MNRTAVLMALTALSQGSRLDVFRLLVEQGPSGMTAGDIASCLGLPKPTLSFHLKELEVAGLISGRQEGRFIRYVADLATVGALVAYLTENCCGGTIRCVPISSRAATARTKRG